MEINLFVSKEQADARSAETISAREKERRLEMPRRQSAMILLRSLDLLSEFTFPTPIIIPPRFGVGKTRHETGFQLDKLRALQTDLNGATRAAHFVVTEAGGFGYATRGSKYEGEDVVRSLKQLNYVELESLNPSKLAMKQGIDGRPFDTPEVVAEAIRHALHPHAAYDPAHELALARHEYPATHFEA